VLTTYNKVLGKKGNIISIFMDERGFRAFLEMLMLVKLLDIFSFGRDRCTLDASWASSVEISSPASSLSR
jgi:hypothetical protein